MDFVHLHTHSHYSLLDGAIKLDKLISKVKELGMHSIALTDHGNLYGAYEFFKLAKAHKIKSIIGCEYYVAVGSMRDRFINQEDKKNYRHLTVLAKNNVGYQNLIKLSTLSFIEGFYSKPRIDKKLLSQCSEGLIALSGCISGDIPAYLLQDRVSEAKKLIHEYQEIFGKDNFYLEIQDHGMPEQKIVNEHMAKLAKELNIGLVATNDVHYLTHEDNQAHDILLCIGNNKKYNDENRQRYSSDQFYLKSPQEMSEIFKDFPEAILNTVNIAEQCNVELGSTSLMPIYPVPDGYTSETYLRMLCYEGLNNRYKTITQEHKDRLEYELKVICDMGFAGYFLIVWDVIIWSRKHGISVGPGRGSVAGSLVSYVLGITNLCPLKYNLIFERFLNPERISMPDIDTDFADTRRPEVINYVIEKYGKDKVAQIITFGTLGAKAALKDVGRVLDIPLAEVNKIASLIPTGPKVTLEDSYDKIAQLKELVNSRPENVKLFHFAKKLEGLLRNPSTHAAGVIISKEPLQSVIPLTNDRKRESDLLITQFEGQHLEACGLLKMDFLGLKNLTMIQKCLDLIKMNHNIDLDLDNIPLDDPDTFKILQESKSFGIFQLESTGMQDLMVRLKPTEFEEIIALIALYRPGPLESGMADQFVERKHHPEKITYPHEKLTSILKDTYGVIVYQEQVMQIAQAISGYSLGKADTLRKAMGKKEIEKMDSFRKEFIDGAEKNNVDIKIASDLYDNIKSFGKYCFNKSHSAGYAVITYQTAYLKAHYPIEFMTSILSCEIDGNNTNRIIESLNECKSLEIEILPPDVNHSFSDFIIVDSKIRFGLAAIKNIGSGCAESIIAEREKNGKYTTIFDFSERINAKLLTKKVFENLIKCGAFDSINADRASLFDSIDAIIDHGISMKREKERGQVSLFDIEEITSTNVIKLKSKTQWDERAKLKFEKEILGVYVSGHPIDRYRSTISNYRRMKISDMLAQDKEQSTVIAGVALSIEETLSKAGQYFANMQIEDESGFSRVLIFPKLYEKCKTFLTENEVYQIEGRIQIDTKTTFIAEEIRLLSDAKTISSITNGTKEQPKTNGYYNNYRNGKNKNSPTEKKVMLNESTKEDNKTNEQNAFGNNQTSPKIDIRLLHLEIDRSHLIKEELVELKKLLNQHQGNCGVMFHLSPKDDLFSNSPVKIKASPKIKVDESEELALSLRKIHSIINAKWY